MPQRKRETRQIRDLVVEVDPLPPRAGFRILARLIRTVGAPAAAGLSDPEKLRALVGSDVSLTSLGLWFVANVLPGLGEQGDAPGLDDAELGRIGEALLVGRLTVNGTAVTAPEVLDVVCGDAFDYMRILRFALEVNFRPTGAGSVTSDGNAPPASAAPGRTPPP